MLQKPVNVAEISDSTHIQVTHYTEVEIKGVAASEVSHIDL